MASKTQGLGQKGAMALHNRITGENWEMAGAQAIASAEIPLPELAPSWD